MAKNEFLPFATADGANVLSAEDYQTLRSRSNGFSAGVARSQELNTVWRQASVIAHVVAQFIADTNNSDVADDGDLDKLQTGLIQALSKNVNNTVPAASLKTAGITQLSSATDSDSETLAATPKAVKAIADNLSGGRLLNIQSFTESGTYTPTPGTRKIRVKCWGAGGGGAGTSTNGGATSGAGGGYVEGLYVLPNIAIIEVVVGSGGDNVDAGVAANGGDGGASSIMALSITADGGGGGQLTGNPHGGKASGPEGSIIFAQGQGGMGSIASFSGGIGGASFSSSGGVPHVSGPGERGGYPGGGGAGASKSSENSAHASGRGADGLVIVEEYS